MDYQLITWLHSFKFIESKLFKIIQLQNILLFLESFTILIS